MKRKFITPFLIAAAFFVQNALPALAEVDINKEFKSPANDLTYIGKLTSAFGSNALVIAGVVFLVLVIVAGYHMINNSGDADKFAQGRDIITYAFLGFLLIFGAYWIIQILVRILGLDLTTVNIF